MIEKRQKSSKGVTLELIGSSINNHYGNNLATIFRNYGLVTLRIAWL